MHTKNSAKERHVGFKDVACLFLFFTLAAIQTAIPSGLRADEVKMGDTVTIVTPGIEARLCPQPGCGPDQHITRIPEGTVLTLVGTNVLTIGTFNVKWFEVIYEDQRGWISIYDTNRAKK